MENKVFGIAVTGDNIVKVLRKLENDSSEYRWSNGDKPTEYIPPETASYIYVYSDYTISYGDYNDTLLNCDTITAEEFLKGFDVPDNVNHPAHYQGKNECIDVMLAMFGLDAVKGFCKCNAYKYRFRADKKNGAEDIAKAEWYESKLIELEGGCK